MSASRYVESQQQARVVVKSPMSELSLDSFQLICDSRHTFQKTIYNLMACPIFCTSEIVSVAQRVIDMIRRRSRGCGKVGSVLCFPLFHTPGMLRSAMLPALAIYNPAMSVV
jgi:hypothetical protein